MANIVKWVKDHARDLVDANTEADQERRKKAGLPTNYYDQSIASRASRAAETGGRVTARVLQGIGQGAGETYDILTPGKGTNRVTQAYMNRGKQTDQEVKSMNLDPNVYKTTQVPLAAASYALPGKVVSNVGKIPKVASFGAKTTAFVNKAPAIAKTTGAITNLTNSSNAAVRVGGKLAQAYTKPGNIANIAADYVQNAGHRNAMGGDNSWKTAGIDLGTSAAMQGGLNLGGQAAHGAMAITNKNVVKPVAKVSTKVADSLSPRYNGLTQKQIIMDPSKLDVIHEAIAQNKGQYAVNPQDRFTPKSGDANYVNKGLRQIQQDHGHDFLTGSNAERTQKMQQFLEQNGAAIPEYQKVLSGAPKPGSIRSLISGPNSQGGYVKNPLASDPLEALKAEARNNGEVILYHRTSKANADQIAKTGKMYSKENTGEVFLSNRPDEQILGYGDTVVPIRVKKSDIRLDDEFPSGEQHFAAKSDRVKPVTDLYNQAHTSKNPLKRFSDHLGNSGHTQIGSPLIPIPKKVQEKLAGAPIEKTNPKLQKAMDELNSMLKGESNSKATRQKINRTSNEYGVSVGDYIRNKSPKSSVEGKVRKIFADGSMEVEIKDKTTGKLSELYKVSPNKLAKNGVDFRERYEINPQGNASFTQAGNDSGLTKMPQDNITLTPSQQKIANDIGIDARKNLKSYAEKAKSGAPIENTPDIKALQKEADMWRTQATMSDTAAGEREATAKLAQVEAKINAAQGKPTPVTAPIEKTPTPKQDPHLKDLNTVRKQLIDEEANTIMAAKPERDLLSEIRQNGGISSMRSYEKTDIPASAKNKNGMPLDEMASTLGFNTEDDLIQALQAQTTKRKMTMAEARKIAEENYNTGKAGYQEDWNTLNQEIEKRNLELQAHGATREMKAQPSSKMNDAEFASLAATAPQQAKTTKQAIGQELATVRADLKTRQQLASEKAMQQRNQVIQGNLQQADALRKQNAAELANIQKLKQQEKALAKQYAEQSNPGLEFTPPTKEITAEDIDTIYTSTLKDKTKKAAFKQIASEYLGDVEAAKITADQKALDFSRTHNLSQSDNLEVIRATGDPNYAIKNKNVKAAVDDLHRTYDDLYKYFTQDKKVDMGYQADYYPREYVNVKTGDQMSSAEYNLLQKSSGRLKGRTSDTLNEWKLKTTDPAEALKSYYANLERAAAGRKFTQQLEQQGLVVRSTGEPVRGMRPIIAEGLQNSDGSIYYAKKEVADKLNSMFGSQEATNAVEKILEKGEGLNSFWQSVVLSGGVPNTPINAFGFMQVMKEGMALHPIKAAKAVYGGFSKDFAQKYFEKNTDMMTLMAKEGIATRYSLSQGAKKGIGRIKDTYAKDGTGKAVTQAWNELTNDSTFSRFMPMLEVEHFKNIYKHGIKKGLRPEQAAKIAGNSTKNFYGISDIYTTKTRNKIVNDATGTFLFAPRFRESMLNFWGKNLQVLNPKGVFKNARSPEYRDNMKFLAAAAVTAAAYDLLNKELTGNHLWDNPDGKKDKLLIPGGALTNGKTLGIPFLPSIATVPRNAAMFGYNTLTGNFGEAGKNAGAFLSMPLKTMNELFTNENYFGQPIVDKEASAPTRIAQGGSYIAQSTMQPWVRESLNAAGQKLPEGAKDALGIKKKSAFEASMNALEAPVRFYDPAYFRGGKQGKQDGKTKDTVASIEAETKARTENLKKTMSPDDWKIYNMSKEEQKKVVDAGIKTQEQLDGLKAYGDNHKKELGYGATAKNVKNYDKLDKPVQSFLDNRSSMDDKQKETWRTSAADKFSKPLLDHAAAIKPDNFPDLPQTNKVAELYAEYKKKEASGLSDLAKETSKKDFLTKAYESAYSEDAKAIRGLSTDNLSLAINNGLITQDQIDEAIKLDDQMIELGLGKQQISNKSRWALGYSSGKSSGSGSGKSGKSGSKKGKAAEIPTSLISQTNKNGKYTPFKTNIKVSAPTRKFAYTPSKTNTTPTRASTNSAIDKLLGARRIS